MIDVLIVGAGPAGLSAAIACAEHGLSVKVLDEFPQPGGRLLGQLHQEPSGEWWNGIAEAKRIYEQAARSGVEIACGISVYDLRKQGESWVVATTAGVFQAPFVLLATGAAETALPIPGWTLPGVMSIGAAQVMTNVHRVRVGKRGVVIGVNLLSVAIARELQLAGIQLAAMVLPAANEITQSAANPAEVMKSLLRVAHLAPVPLIRWGSKLMGREWLRRLAVRCYPENGVKIWDIPIHLRTAALEICGEEKVEGVRLAQVTAEGTPVAGSERIIEADFVCIAGGLFPLVELAAVAGCPFAFLPELGGHVPLHNERMKTPVQGLYVAGNITGIESAKVAIAQGKLAGLSIAADRKNGPAELEKRLQQAVSEVQTVRSQATIQFQPGIEQGRKRMEMLYEDLAKG
jgi:sarcosine oxidase subunit alpha